MAKLKIDWSDLSMDAKWYDFENGDVVEGEPKGDGTYFKIRPYPTELAGAIIKDGGFLMSGEQRKKIHDHCLVSWKGLVDANNKDIPFSEDTKEKIFKYSLGGISAFVFNRSTAFGDKKKAQEKNS